TAIEDVEITLTGVDDRGNAVLTQMTTDSQGLYEFVDLRPGTYAVLETQPAGYQDGKDSLGTINGLASGDGSLNDQFHDLIFAEPDFDAVNYNFGERPLPGSTVAAGQTASIGFWQNKNGQSLIKSLNGGPGATNL